LRARKSKLSNVHGYLAFPGFLDDLALELRFAGIKPKKMEFHGDLILVEGFRRKPIWARNIWGSVERIPFQSVSEAVHSSPQSARSRGLIDRSDRG